MTPKQTPWEQLSASEMCVQTALRLGWVKGYGPHCWRGGDSCWHSSLPSDQRHYLGKELPDWHTNNGLSIEALNSLCENESYTWELWWNEEGSEQYSIHLSKYLEGGSEDTFDGGGRTLSQAICEVIYEAFVPTGSRSS